MEMNLRAFEQMSLDAKEQERGSVYDLVQSALDRAASGALANEEVTDEEWERYLHHAGPLGPDEMSMHTRESMLAWERDVVRLSEEPAYQPVLKESGGLAQYAQAHGTTNYVALEHALQEEAEALSNAADDTSADLRHAA